MACTRVQRVLRPGGQAGVAAQRGLAAQQPVRPFRIGVLAFGQDPASPLFDAFRDEMRQCSDGSIGADDTDQYSEERFLLVKNLIFFFGHVFINATIYMGVIGPKMLRLAGEGARTQADNHVDEVDDQRQEDQQRQVGAQRLDQRAHFQRQH